MNKRLVLTGGTKGIGRALVERFAREGFDIITCSRSERDLNRLKKEIEGKYPGIKLKVIEADLSSREQLNAFAEAVKAEGEAADVLINNTGVFIPGQLHSEEEGVLEMMLDTNLLSAYHLTRALLPPMMEKKKGHIFNICSTASIVAYPNGGSYCITKFAMLGMSKVLREEMKPYNIRVSSVMPGATLTASWEGVDLPAERFMKAEDVAEIIWTAYQLSGRTVMEEIVLRPLEGDIV